MFFRCFSVASVFLIVCCSYGFARQGKDTGHVGTLAGGVVPSDDNTDAASSASSSETAPGARISDLLGKLLSEKLASSKMKCKGRVVSETGEGIEGADIEIYDVVRWVDNPPLGVRLLPVATAKTDEKGNYTIERAFPGAAAEFSVVFARAQGYCVAWVEYAMLTDIVKDIELSGKSVSISGKVVDPDGAPITGARVHAAVYYRGFNKHYNPIIPAAASKWLTTETDGSGSFTFSNLPPNSRAEFSAIARGYGRHHSWDAEGGSIKLRYVAGDTSARIIMSPSASIEGRVVDDSAKGIGAVKVFVLWLREGPNPPRMVWTPQRGVYIRKSSFSNSRELVTNEKGEFFADDFNPGRYAVFLDPFSNPERKWVSDRSKITLSASQTGQVLLEAAKPGYAKVRVVEAGTGRPIDSVRMRLALQSDQPGTTQSRAFRAVLSTTTGETVYEAYDRDALEDVQTVVTPQDGTVFFNLRPGKYKVSSLTKRDYVYGKQTTFEVISAETTEVQLQMQHKAGLEGTCVDGQGNPVPKAGLRFLPSAKAEWFTDEGGGFQINPGREHFSQPRNEYPLVAENFQAGLGGLVKLQRNYNQTEPVTIRLEPFKYISGHVIDQDGNPIGDAVIEARIGESLHVEFENDLYLTTVTDAGGMFELPNLIATSSYMIVASANGYGIMQKFVLPSPAQSFAEHNRSYMKDWTFSSDVPGRSKGFFSLDRPETHIGDFVLKAASLTVSGIVVDPKGYPRPGETVQVRGDQQVEHEPVQTDKAGRFFFANLADGDVRVAVGVNWFANAKVPAGTHGVRIIITDFLGQGEGANAELLWPAAHIQISLFDANTGKALTSRQTKVVIEQEKGNAFRLPLTGVGTGEVAVSRGRHTIAVGSDTSLYKSERVTLDVEPGITYPVEIKLKPKSPDELPKPKVPSPLIAPWVISREPDLKGQWKQLYVPSRCAGLRYQVNNEMTGVGVAGATVNVSFREGKGRYEGATNANGLVRFGILEKGKYTITSVSAPGYEPLEPNRVFEHSGAGSVGSGCRVKPHPATVTLNVVDIDGRPVSGASIYHRYKRDSYWKLLKTGPTDAQGFVEIEWTRESEGFEPQIEHVLVVRKNGVVAAQRVWANADDAIVVQQRSGVIPTGRVVDAQGNPVEGCPGKVSFITTGCNIPCVETQTDADGRFVGGPVPVGFRYRFYCHIGGRSTGLAFDVTGEDGENMDIGDIIMPDK